MKTKTMKIRTIAITEPATDWRALGARITDDEEEALQAAYQDRAIAAVQAAHPGVAVSFRTASVVSTLVDVSTDGPTTDATDHDSVCDHVRVLLDRAWMTTCEEGA